MQVARWQGAKTAYIEPGSPWEDGYCESSNSKLRVEFLNGQIADTAGPESSNGYRLTQTTTRPWVGEVVR